MGIYFRDILLIRISRGANNCGQHSLEKNIYFIMRFSPHFQLFYFNDRLEFCEFFEWKIKRINNADLFSQPPLLIFIKGANISGGHCRCRFLEASWRRCYNSSGFSLSQFVLFLHVIPDRLDDDEIRSLCGSLAVVRLFVQTKISLDYYN